MSGKITSPDGALEIIRSSVRYFRRGPKIIEVAVKNSGSSNVNAEISVDLYDLWDNVIDNITTIFKDIAPEETKHFDISTDRSPKRFEIESHKIKSVRVI